MKVESLYAKTTAAIILALGMTSCGATKLSPENISEFNAGTHAIVQTYNQPLLAGLVFGEQPFTQIMAVDGKKTDLEYLVLDERITVNVGLHKITLSCKARGGYDERDFSEVIELDLKPHYEYAFRCSFDSDFGPDGSYTGSFSVKETRVD